METVSSEIHRKLLQFVVSHIIGIQINVRKQDKIINGVLFLNLFIQDEAKHDLT